MKRMRGPGGLLLLLWAAQIPAVEQSKWYFRQLHVNGQRRPRARLPREGYYKIAAPADPLFVDPRNGDFSLKPQSPAFQLGFRPIDLKQVGVRPRQSLHP
jgi:hypothetical protein